MNVAEFVGQVLVSRWSQHILGTFSLKTVSSFIHSHFNLFLWIEKPKCAFERVSNSFKKFGHDVLWRGRGETLDIEHVNDE